MSNPIVAASAAGNAALRSMLEQHPLVRLTKFEAAQAMRIEFDGQSGTRSAWHARPDVDGPYGLTELMDNNPLVCAKQASVTGAGASLTLIALGPLAKAELILDMPAIALNFQEPNPEEINAALATEGWRAGASVATADDLPEVFEAQCLANIRTQDASDLDNLYAECFGRSFFVRASTETPEAGDPHATYSISVADHGDGTALATVTARSARDGKVGAGGLVHLFNVMCGFEESLGVAGIERASAET